MKEKILFEGHMKKPRKWREKLSKLVLDEKDKRGD